MKATFTILFLLTIITLSAQVNRQEEQLKVEADKYFNEEQYNLAIEYYRRLSNLSDQNAEVNYQLAESYRKSFLYNEAEVYYLKTYEQAPALFPLSVYYYSLMLKLNGEFEKSITYFTEFILTHEHKGKLQEYIEQAIVDRAGSEMAKTELNNASLYSLESIPINTAFNDYAPAILDSTTLIITSGRVESNREAIDERYGEAFTDNFYFTKKGNVWQDKTKQLFQITNTRYNDGSGCFNGKGDKYYFTVCGKDGPQCRIYLSELKNNQWSSPKILNENVNFKNFETKHPAVSKGGDTLLFSTNRTGGYGKYDIWMSINAGNENWGPAINLGNTINTKLNELAPAYTNFSHIFFIASDGHQNYGGLDLYMVKRFSTGEIALYNLDYPFSSNRDDCFITFSANQVYFSSNRAGGLGGFDIYAVPISSVISFVSRLGLKKRDARMDVKLNARIENLNNLDLLTARNEDRIEYENLTYAKRKIVDKMLSNQANAIVNKMEDFGELTEEEYRVLMRISETQFKTQELEKRFAKTFLSRISSPADTSAEFSVTGSLIDSLSGKLLSRKILLMDESGEVLKITTSNEQGKFRFTNIPASTVVYLRLEIPPNSEEKIQIRNLTVTHSERENTDTFESIYFDFNLAIIRPEAKVILDELAKFLNNAPSVQVELYAYTDDLGTDEYNMTLSQKRGQAVLTYLTTKGVDQTALSVIAKGKQKNPLTDIEMQRQFNRRVEFYLNGVETTPGQIANTYILRAKSNWNTLSHYTGISVHELKKLNGALVDELQAFQPVRIPFHAKEISEVLFFDIR